MNFSRFFTKSRARLVTGFVVFLRVVTIASIALAANPGGTITVQRAAPNFRFELESPPQSLKDVPTWWELEQLLDHPYAMQLASDQHFAEELSGFPAYETGGPVATSTSIQRRRSYLPPGCTYQTPLPAGLVACDDALLPPFLVHPLNYNYMTGEEARQLNPNYAGSQFGVPSELIQCGIGDPNEPDGCAVEVTANSAAGPVVSPANDPNRWMWVYETVDVTPGDERVQESTIDFNSPFAADTQACIVSTEPPEGAVICGGDPGEPNYFGFGVFNASGYSTPAIRNVASPNTPISGLGTGNHRLFDPAGCADRNAVSPGSCANGGFIVRLLKPTLRPNLTAQPNYLRNSVANLTVNGAESLVPSNENDYFRGNNLAQKQISRDAAAALGKALFWDMQVGSDGVQACASCHFVAGADDRTKNQVNPNHIGIPADLTFQLHQPNEELVPTDFPFSNGGDTANHNDVVSSMGVHWGVFSDVPTINTWVVNASGVRTLPTDVRQDNPQDPIPGFAGDNGNEFRRVEPRNTPTLIAADFNFDNFWDGRARHDFNGGSVFGAADPQAHIFVNSGGQLVATRQLIRNVSLASLATGPGLSEFEMSFLGRNWQKVGKKLLQGATTSTVADNVTPLANQLVDTTDSVLGIYSNQGGTACNTTNIPLVERSGSWVTNTDPGLAPGKPGLCISYAGLIRRAFYPQLWQNTTWHLNGAADAGDPFDGYTLTIASGPAVRTNTNQFTQMEGNFSLFWGLSIHAWGAILIPDNTPFDQMMDANPDSFKSLGEPNEPGLTWDMLGCDQTGGVQPCYTEVGPFKRDPGIPLNITGDAAPEAFTTGTRQPGDPDPLLGFDIFYGLNLSGKNPDFRTTRCGECHAAGTTTDHTVEISNQLSLGDFVGEFVTPGVEILIEPLGRNRLVTGFGLESELNGNAQDAVERRIANQNNFNPADGLTYPDGSSFFDNGMYNLGVTPCEADYSGATTNCNDISRGGNDAFGNPLSLATLMLQNLDAGAVPGTPLSTFDPDFGVTGGLFEESGQDQSINPGFEEEPLNPMLPPHLAPWASNITVGDETEQDEAGGGGGGMVNTLIEDPIMEGMLDTLGPFNPAGVIGEIYNMAPPQPMGTWPVVNRVGRAGSFKAPQLRNIELTGPYFHNGGKLTLAQVVDFYTRGGDFPNTNAIHRDFNLMDQLQDGQALGGLTPQEQNERIVALIDFLLTLTDDRVRNEQAPFDHPEIFVPLDGTAPENTFGRPGFLDNEMFLQILAVGAGGLPAPVDSFMQVTNDRGTDGLTGFNCSASAGPVSQYCVQIDP